MIIESPVSIGISVMFGILRRHQSSPWNMDLDPSYQGAIHNYAFTRFHFIDVKLMFGRYGLGQVNLSIFQ